jgi:hypothetical protein
VSGRGRGRTLLLGWLAVVAALVAAGLFGSATRRADAGPALVRVHLTLAPDRPAS